MSHTDLAHSLISDAITLARLQRDQRAYAVLAWETTLPDNPSELFINALGQERTLFWTGNEWQLGLGQAWHVASDGPGRGIHSAEEFARLEARTVVAVHGDQAMRETLPACLTALSFEETPPAASHWGEHLPGAQIWLPKKLLWRRADGTSWTIVGICVHANDSIEKTIAALLAEPEKSSTDSGVSWPTIGCNYIDEVEDAVALIRDGALRKVVLARAVDHPLGPGCDEAQLLKKLRQIGERSTLYAHDLPGAGLFCGITPEILFTAQDRQLSTMALAGTTRRGKNADEDAGLVKSLIAGTKERKEHGVVVEHLVAVLRTRAAPFVVPTAPSPRLLDRVIHLETVIKADLDRADYLEVLSSLHPTPAVCGLPTATATHYIARREKLHRGLYAGAMGFITVNSARFFVPLRGGIIRHDLGKARLFAGAGIIESSNPADELAETELKFSVMRHVLE